MVGGREGGASGGRSDGARGRGRDEARHSGAVLVELGLGDGVGPRDRSGRSRRLVERMGVGDEVCVTKFVLLWWCSLGAFWDALCLRRQRWEDAMIQDLRFGLRVLLKHPGFTLIAVFTLALGIGANTAMFSVVNAVLLRPLPYPESDRLVSMAERSPQLERMFIAYPNLLDWRAQNDVFEQIAAFRRLNFNLVDDGEPERLIGAQVSADLFPALRVRAALGRTFSLEEDKPGSNPVVVLSHGLWSRRFGADSKIVGRSIALNGKSYQVTGVMPAGFQFPRRADLWMSLGQTLSEPGWSERGRGQGLYGIARLKPGVTLPQARSEMETIALRLEQQYPETNQGRRVSLIPLLEETVGEIRPVLLVLQATVGFVLLIACANIALLLLARTAARQKGMAIRLALGAGRWRLLRQLLVESVMLALLGGGLGLWLASQGVRLIVATNPSGPNAIPRAQEIGPDWQMVIFTAAISILTGLIFGLAPAWKASKAALNEALKDSSRGLTSGPSQRRFRDALVSAEVALSLILLIGAGLMVKSLYHLQRVNPGFQADHLLTLQLELPVSKYSTDQEIINFYERLLERLNALPGAQSASAAGGMPIIGGGTQAPFHVEGQPEPKPGEAPIADLASITPDYFHVMGMTLRRGRAFTEQDDQNATRVIIVDDSFAERHWPNAVPLGKRVQLGDNEIWWTVVGVVGRVKQEGLERETNRVQAYLPFLQNPWRAMTIGVRSAADPTSLIAAVRQQVLTLDRDLPIFSVRTMEQILTDSIASYRLSTLLLSAFAAVALILASIGIYGVMSYSVEQRTHEIGIRLALGGQVWDVLKLVVGQGMALTSIGASLGLAGGFALTRFMKTLLFGVSAADPWTFATVAVSLLSVALLACYLPARRATKVDPLLALRHE